MLFLQILLIPFKLIIKLLGFCLSGVVKLIGLTVITFSRFCGIVTNLVGGLLLKATEKLTFYLKLQPQFPKKHRR